MYWYKEQVSKERLLDLDAFGDDDDIRHNRLEDTRRFERRESAHLVHNMYYIMQISANGGNSSRLAVWALGAH